MAENRDGLHSVLIGVGGLLDVFAGRTKRAPESWRRCGLEWAYRLLREPRRAGRMIRLPTVLVLAARERLSRRNNPRTVLIPINRLKDQIQRFDIAAQFL